MIELKDVYKTYRGAQGLEVHALRGLSLRIEKGEFVAIMGASGSGKSTLMNVLGALDQLTSGSYAISGEEVGGMTDEQLSHLRNRRIGFVFQAFHLLPLLNAMENVELPLTYSAGVDGAEARERALKALASVGLADRAGHRPGEMSGGQQQRVAIARALVTDAEVILADEPTGNLDSVAASEVMAIFARLWQAGKTLVLVTHSPEVAEYAPRVVTVRDGAIVSDVANPSPRTAEAPVPSGEVAT